MRAHINEKYNCTNTIYELRSSIYVADVVDSAIQHEQMINIEGDDLTITSYDKIYAIFYELKNIEISCHNRDS